MINDKQQMLNLPKLILASGSPRRSEILGFVGWDFVKKLAEVDESELQNERAEDYVQRLAKEKASAVAAKFENTLVLGADTIVVIDEKIIGKPRDLAEAHSMIKMLSGRWHEVLTGVAIVKVSDSKSQISATKGGNPTVIEGAKSLEDPQSVVGLQSTKVKFAELNDEEIAFLVEKGEPLDKAGAYAVQAQAALFIEEIQGDYWNVVGLPINLVYQLVRKFDKK
jgi:septum formation protein